MVRVVFNRTSVGGDSDISKSKSIRVDDSTFWDICGAIWHYYETWFAALLCTNTPYLYLNNINFKLFFPANMHLSSDNFPSKWISTYNWTLVIKSPYGNHVVLFLWKSNMCWTISLGQLVLMLLVSRKWLQHWFSTISKCWISLWLTHV